MKQRLTLLIIASIALLTFTQCTTDKREEVIDKTVKNERIVSERPIGNGLFSKGAIKENAKTICYITEVRENEEQFSNLSETAKAEMKGNALHILQNSVGMRPLFEVEATIMFRYQDTKGKPLLEITFTPEDYSFSY